MVLAMSDSIPTGEVSFLFTDVEGSTRLWEADAEGMAASLALHDRIVRDVVAARGGHVFSTAGDAFAVSFWSVGDALEAATEVQLRLATATWPGPALEIRMGIHVGTAEERGGDYFGPILNRAARIMSAGHGGQILVSSVAAASSPATITLADLGTHHLKDIDDPEHLFEVRHPDLPVVERPIKTVDIRRHNLPDHLTSFVGRARELDDLADLLSEHRLVTLTGVGGTGKTRLAIEAARAATRPDGAWLVELAPVTDPAHIMSTIGDIWGLRPGEGASIEDVVTRYLWSRDLMLIVDNCEHLIDAAARAIRLLLDSCPKLRVIATSRESLGIRGESMLRVPSLTLASGASGESEAVELFLDRARSVRPDFEPSQPELAEVNRICARIDGIPLGIELAAARMRSLSPSELADRLEHSFRILSGSAKTALPRQRTLHATIDWSYDLLEPAEQAMFRRLSVFTGGFGIVAVEAVCVGEPVDDWAVVDHMDSLVDKSLVITLHSGGGTRYRMLEPVRQFAQERLSDTAEPERFQAAHARHFASFVADTSPRMRGPEQMDALRSLDVDYDNIRTAFRTLLETGDIDRHATMAFDLFSYWMHRGMQLEGIEIGVAGLEAAGEGHDPLGQIKAWWSTAILAAEATQPEGIDHARAGLEIARRHGDDNAIGRMELALGAAIRHATTDPEYLGHLLEGRRLLESRPEPHWWDPRWERGLINLLLAAYLPEEDDRVREHLDTALAVFEDYGDRGLLAATLADSAGLYFDADPEVSARGLANVRRACEIYSDIDSPNWYGHALYYLGILLRYEEEHSEAIEHLQRGARLLETVGDVSCWAGATRHLAATEVNVGRSAAAAERLVAVIDRIPSLPMQEIAKPRTLDGAARVLLSTGRIEDAATILGMSLAIELPQSSLPRESELAALREELSEKLGVEELERLLDRGRAMEIDDALELARSGLTPEL